LGEFLDDFPTVTQQALSLFELMRERLALNLKQLDERALESVMDALR
jgi:hypothetical protein